jgi:hypothetical protein
MILELNGIEIDVSQNNSFALSFSASKLQDIESRSGDFSTTFTLPLSNEVRRAIGYTNHLDSGSSLPYQVLDAKVFDKGLLVFSGFAKISRITENLELAVYSGNSNWIELIRDKKLNEVNYSTLNFTMNAANVQARRLNLDRSGIVYPNAFYGEFANPASPWTFYDFFPAYYCNGLLLRIFLDIGWSVAGDLFSNPKFLDSLVPFSGPKIGTDDEVILVVADVNVPIGTVSGGALTTYLGFNSGTNFLNTVDMPTSNTISIGGAAKVRIHDDGYYTLAGTINCSLLSGTLQYSSVYLVPIGSGIEYELFVIANTTSLTDIGFGWDGFIKKGEYVLRFYYDLFGTSSFSITAGSILLIVNDSASLQPKQDFSYNLNVPEGFTVKLNKGLPNVLQTDFIKTIVNQFNVVIEADYINKVVKFNQFDNLETNKPLAKDWTHKVDLTEPIELEFEQDTYGQVNHLTYEPDDADDYIVIKTLGDSSFTISNVNLEPSKDVFSLPFSGSVRAFIGEVEVLVIPARLAATKPRICLIDYTTENLITMVGQSAPANSIELKFEGLDFATLLTENYTYLISILQKYKLAKINLKLNSIDLQNLEYTKPIYLNFETKENGQISGYFYLNFIEQFQENKTTKVELIKL